MIKPDAVFNGAAGNIISAIEQEGFVIVGQIKRTLSHAEAEAFYGEHKGKPFFDGLITFMTSGRWERVHLKHRGRENTVLKGE